MLCFAVYVIVETKHNAMGVHAMGVQRSYLRITARLILVLIIALSRYCHVLVEQPRSSVMPSLKHFQQLAKKLGHLFGLSWEATNMCCPNHCFSTQGAVLQIDSSWYQ